MALVQRRSAAAASDRAARSRTSTPDDEEDEEESRPTRRRGAAAKPEFKAPRGRDDEAEDLPDEDEDERPARGGRGRGSAPAGDAVKSGWGAAKRLKQEGGDFAQEFKFDKEPQLVKFLEDAPFAVYKQHWIEGLRSTGKKSFICLGKGCPLCSVPDSPSKKWAFNIAVIDEDGEAEVKALIAGSRLFDQIADEHDLKKGIDNGFWALSKSGKKQTTTYKLDYVKERDLEEDWGVKPEDAEDALTGLVPYTAEQYKPSSRSYLEEIADELTDGDD